MKYEIAFYAVQDINELTYKLMAGLDIDLSFLERQGVTHTASQILDKYLSVLEIIINKHEDLPVDKKDILRRARNPFQQVREAIISEETYNLLRTVNDNLKYEPETTFKDSIQKLVDVYPFFKKDMVLIEEFPEVPELNLTAED